MELFVFYKINNARNCNQLAFAPRTFLPPPPITINTANEKIFSEKYFPKKFNGFESNGRRRSLLESAKRVVVERVYTAWRNN